MPQGNRAAIDVELRRIDRKLGEAREDLRCKRLVDLDEVDLIERQSGEPQRLVNGRHGTAAEELGLNPGCRVCDQAAERRGADRLRTLAAHDDHR